MLDDSAEDRVNDLHFANLRERKAQVRIKVEQK